MMTQPNVFLFSDMARETALVAPVGWSFDMQVWFKTRVAEIKSLWWLWFLMAVVSNSILIALVLSTLTPTVQAAPQLQSGLSLIFVKSRPEVVNNPVVPAPARIVVSSLEVEASSTFTITFGAGDVFTQEDTLLVDDVLAYPTVLYKERQKNGTSWLINRPHWIGLRPLTYLREGTLVPFVTWEFYIGQERVFSTAESITGFVTVKWETYSVELPNGNPIMLTTCVNGIPEDVFIRFEDDGMPVFLLGVSSELVYTVAFNTCPGGKPEASTMSFDQSIPVGEVDSTLQFLWRHFIQPVTVEVVLD